MSAQSKNREVSLAISRGLNGLLVSSAAMLLVALFWAPIRGNTLTLVAIPLALALAYSVWGMLQNHY